MQLRTKLLTAFGAMILLAGIIAYTSYDALQEKNPKRPENPRKRLNGPKEKACCRRMSNWKALWRFCLRPRNSFPPRLNRPGF